MSQFYFPPFEIRKENDPPAYEFYARLMFVYGNTFLFLALACYFVDWEDPESKQFWGNAVIISVFAVTDLYTIFYTILPTVCEKVGELIEHPPGDTWKMSDEHLDTMCKLSSFVYSVWFSLSVKSSLNLAWILLVSLLFTVVLLILSFSRKQSLFTYGYIDFYINVSCGFLSTYFSHHKHLTFGYSYIGLYVIILIFIFRNFFPDLVYVMNKTYFQHGPIGDSSETSGGGGGGGGSSSWFTIPPWLKALTAPADVEARQPTEPVALALTAPPEPADVEARQPPEPVA